MRQRAALPTAPVLPFFSASAAAGWPEGFGSLPEHFLISH